MIGNSPKSDINPALEAGLDAVLVPHAHTWVLEHQDLRRPGDEQFLRWSGLRICDALLNGGGSDVNQVRLILEVDFFLDGHAIALGNAGATGRFSGPDQRNNRALRLES